MDKIAVFKNVVQFTIGIGASTIVKQIIENNVDPVKTIDKIAVPVASLAIGGAVAKIAGEYTNDMIDTVVEALKKTKITVTKTED